MMTLLQLSGSIHKIKGLYYLQILLNSIIDVCTLFSVYFPTIVKSQIYQ